MSAEQTSGAPTEQEWAEALQERGERDTPTWGPLYLTRDDYVGLSQALAPLIARVEAAARAEGMAAVAEPVLEVAEHFEHPENGYLLGEKYATRLRAAIPTDAAEAVAQVKARWQAEAWDEGYQDGARQDAEGEDGPRFVNPYRIEVGGRGSDGE